MIYTNNKKLKSALLILLIPAFFSAYSQSKHFIDVWGGGGYSSLCHEINNTKVPGGAGYSLGFGYEYNPGRFIILTGLEFMHLNSATKLGTYETEKKYIYPHIDEYDHYISYLYTINDYKEKHSFGYLNIPLQFGAKFDRYYAIAGVKVGLNLFGAYKLTSNILTKGADPMFIDTISGVPAHHISSRPYDGNGKLNLALNITPGAEFGVYLDDWLPRNFTRLDNRRRTNVSYRLGAFLDYGITNINIAGTENPHLNYPTGSPGDEVNPQDVSLNSLAASDLAANKRFGSLYAGIKLTVLFDITKQRKAKPAQQQQLLPFYARVVDAETNNNVDAEVSLKYTSGNRNVFTQKTNSDGIVSHSELRKGRYAIQAKSDGYWDYKKIISYNKLDTVLVPLQRIHELYVRVIDAETKENLQATIVLNTEDNKPLINKTTNERGLFGSELQKGKYHLHVSSEGYIYHQETIEYLKTDTVYVALQPIKKDTRIILHNLFFEFDSSVIKPESDSVIEELYQFLSNNPEIRIKIVGHTDNLGTEKYNETLSNNRAKAVYNAVVEKGIIPERLSWEGKGASDPITTNETEEGRAENRRVEFVIL